MVRDLLVRGMLVGAVAGLLVFAFSKVFGEPQIEHAIAFETHRDAAQDHMDVSKDMDISKAEDAEPELVSRDVQAGLGLFTGVMVYSTAFGGLFALVFAFAYGRIGTLDPRALSALLAAAGCVAIYVVPSLKYPANPPSVGLAETIGYRSALFCLMITISVAAMVGAAILRRRLVVRHDGWSAALIAATAYLAVIIVVQLLLPSIDEVPDQFPAAVLWRFRIASLGAQLVMWTTIGLLFGALTERAAAGARGRARGPGLNTVLRS